MTRATIDSHQRARSAPRAVLRFAITIGILGWTMFGLPLHEALADIYQWEYVDPADPSQGKQKSTTLAPNGAGRNTVPGADFSWLNLTKGYFIEADLTNARFDNGTLTDADFSQANLTNAVFTFATLTGADFTGAQVQGANLTATVFRGFTAAQLYVTASYQAQDLTGIRLAENNLSGWNFTDQNLTNVNFQFARLANADFTGAQVQGTNLLDTTSRGFTAAQLYSTASYQARDLTGIRIPGNNLSGWNFAGQNLTNAYFASANLTNADFSQANLTNAILYNSTVLTGANLIQANLTNARLSQAVLTAANLSQANLMNADFQYARFTDADLSQANLANASFGNATLTDADLTGAHVQGAGFYSTTSRGFTAAQLYSTASYRAQDLIGIGLGNNNLSGWNFAGQNLTNADFTNATLTCATFDDADVRGAALSYWSGDGTGFTLAQLYSTASYKNRDLTGIILSRSNLSDWNFTDQNLTNVNFQFARLANADFTGAQVQGTNLLDTTSQGFTAAQLYSTASYQAQDLTGIRLSHNDLTGWNFASQNLIHAEFGWTVLMNADFSQANLTNAILGGAALTGAVFDGAEVRGADLSDYWGDGTSGITLAQLYSTTSYKNRDLTGIQLWFNDLSGADFTGQNLTNAGLYWATLTNADLSQANLANAGLGAATLTGANLTGANLTNAEFWDATLTNADLTGADARGAQDLVLPASAVTANLIQSDGRIAGLNLSTGEQLWVRDYDGNESWESPPIAIHVEDHFTMADGGALRVIFEVDAWDSTISFSPGIPVALGGTLELVFAADTDLASQVGRTIQLFDWTGVNPLGTFAISSPYVWDTSHLYTTGEVTLAAVPEPSTALLAIVGGVLVAVTQMKRAPWSCRRLARLCTALRTTRSNPRPSRRCHGRQDAVGVTVPLLVARSRLQRMRTMKALEATGRLPLFDKERFAIRRSFRLARRTLPIAVAQLLALVGAGPVSASELFDFQSVLFGPPSTLFVSRHSLDTTTGAVGYTGVDTAMPPTPFTWDWGDGTVTNSFFPTSHVYADTSRDYAVTVTSHYPGGGSSSARSVVRFTAPQITPVPLPSNLQVTIPDQPVALTTRLYTPPSSLTHFGDSSFSSVSRSTFEYILTAAATVQASFVRGNTYLSNGEFPQVVLRDPTFSGGMYSVWFTDPIAFGVGGSALDLEHVSSYFHEMGHNVTLNYPAPFIYGGRIDGNANAIYSETMAQIFQHATAYHLVNHAAEYGLEDVAVEIELSALSSMRVVRNAFDRYIANGSQFRSWNDPAVGGDETFDTFMTLAYKFFEHAETSGQGYEGPLMRMTDMLSLFDPALWAEYDQFNNTPAADTFRSTLMVAAMSHAFKTDLREEFRSLNFPISDATYDQLIAIVPEPSTALLAIVGGVLVGAACKRRPLPSRRLVAHVAVYGLSVPAWRSWRTRGRSRPSGMAPPDSLRIHSMLLVFALLAATNSVEAKEIHFVYLSPSDVAYRPEYEAAIENAARTLQAWFYEELGGQTFALNDDVVEWYQTPHDTSWYQTDPMNPAFDSLRFWSSAAADAFQLTGGYFFDPDNIWVLYLDADPLPGQAVGGNASVALLPAHDLAGLNGESSEPVSRWIGGSGHELGHALLLPHPPDSPGGPDDWSLMYYGYLTFPETYLRSEDRNALLNSGYFVHQIPEPSTFVLAGLAFAALFLIARRPGHARQAVY